MSTRSIKCYNQEGAPAQARGRALFNSINKMNNMDKRGCAGYKAYVQSLPPMKRKEFEAQVSLQTGASIYTVKTWLYMGHTPNMTARKIISDMTGKSVDELFPPRDANDKPTPKQTEK